MLLQVFRELLDGHPVYSRIPFIGLDSLQCLLAVFQLADFFHQSFGFSQAFSLSLRHQRFEPFLGDLRSITLTFHRKGQHPLFGLVFLSLSAHESRRLLALPLFPFPGTVRAFDHRSRRGLSVAPPFGFRSASIASPTAWPTLPFADFYDKVR